MLIILSADDIYYANIIGATLLAALRPFYQINLAKLIRNGNMVNKDTIVLDYGSPSISGPIRSIKMYS